MSEIHIFLVVIYLILVLGNLYYGFNLYNNRIVARANFIKIDAGKILAFTLMIFLIYLACIDDNNPDYNSYYLVYNGSLGYDLGFNTVKTFFLNRGFDFRQFRIAVYIFSYLCIWIFTCNIDLNVNITFALYSIYPFFYDAIQLRNLLAVSIIFLFLPFLMRKDKFGVIVFCFAVLLSASMHRLALIYILLVLLVMKESKIKNRLLISIFICSLVILLLCKLSSTFYAYLINAFGGVATDIRYVYYQRDTVHMGFLLYIAMEGLYLLSSYFAKKAVIQNPSGTILQYYSEFIWQVNIIISFTFPVFLISAEFYRIFRNIALLNYYIPVINLLSKKDKDNKNVNIQISNSLFVCAFLLNWLYQTNVDSFERVFWIFFD